MSTQSVPADENGETAPKSQRKSRRMSTKSKESVAHFEEGKKQKPEKGKGLRPEVLCKGERLASDPNYPDDAILKEISRDITEELLEEEEDSTDFPS